MTVTSLSQLGVIHKPRGQLRGMGVSQMTILLHKPYLVKVTTKGGGGSKIPEILTTWFMNDPKVKYVSNILGHNAVESYGQWLNI